MENFEIINIGKTKLYNFAQSTDVNISNAFTSLFFELYVNPIMNTQMFLYEHPHISIKDKIIIDCGANMGLFSAWAATHCKQVYAFEPALGILPYLNKTASLYDNITIIPKGVAEQCKNDYFMECYFSCGSHLNKYNLNKNCLDKQLYEIKLTSLDDYFNNTSVDYIKIDVEGAELDVLNGASNLINQCSPCLAIACYHYEGEVEKIQEKILSLNSNYNFSTKGDILFAWI